MTKPTKGDLGPKRYADLDFEDGPCPYCADDMTPTPAPSAQDAAASEGPSLAEIEASSFPDLAAIDGWLREFHPVPSSHFSVAAVQKLRALLTAATERAADYRKMLCQAQDDTIASEAALTEMTRRRDEWRKKAEGYEDLRNAVREKAKAAGPSIGRALLIGSIVDKDAEIAELRAALARKDAEADEVDAARIEAETAVGYHKEKLRQAEVERDEWRDRAEKERSAKKRAEAALAEKAAGWQLIESAPKDGTRFLAYEPSDYYQRYECWWQDDFTVWVGWQNDGDNEPEPTHWMPLPAAPALAEKGDARDA